MRDEMIRTITDGLKWLVFKLDGRSVARLYDLHVVSEDSVKDLLNCLRCLNLENLNKGGVNFPAIDLGDKAQRLSFQITTEKAAIKLQSSLETFHRHKLDVDYDQVFFLILGKKQKKYSAVKSSGIVFDSSKHVLDIDDLIREAASLPDGQLASMVAIIKAAGLEVSKAQDTDEQAFKKLHAHFDRDALKHLWHQEGSIAGFEAALTDLTELLGQGTVRSQRITKPVYQFARELEKDLAAIKSALSELRAKYNEHVYTKEIRPADGVAFFKDAETPVRLNAAKLKVIEAVNRMGSRYSLQPIRMNNP